MSEFVQRVYNRVHNEDMTMRVLFQLKGLFVLCLCLDPTRQTWCEGVGEGEGYTIETQRTRFSASAKTSWTLGFGLEHKERGEFRR